MATNRTTTVPGGRGTHFLPADQQTQSPIGRAFGILLSHFTEMTAAETRIETGGLDVLGLELLQELRAAERSREALIEAAFDVIATPEVGPDDHGLQRMAHLLTELLALEDDAERQRLHAQTSRHRDLFDIPVAGPAALKSRRMQTAFFRQFDALAELQEYGGAGIAPEVQVAFPEPVPA